jgi:hypothetical protein
MVQYTGAAGAPVLTRAAVMTVSGTAAANTVVPVDTTAGAVTVTLPTAPAQGTVVVVKAVVFGAGNNVTFACGGADVINTAGGPASGTLKAVNQAVYLCYDTATAIWTDLADDLPLSYLDTLFLQVANNLSDVASPSAALGHIGGAAVNDPLQLGVTGTFISQISISSANVASANSAWYTRCVSAGYAMSNITVQVNVSSGNVCVAAYQASGSGASAVPAAQYQTSGSVACPASGSATIALGGSCTPKLADFLALAADNTTATFFEVGGFPASSSLAAGFNYTQGAAFPLPNPAASLTADGARSFPMRGS